MGSIAWGRVGAVIYLWQRFIGKSDKAVESLLSVQLEHLEEKIDNLELKVDNCLAELKLKVNTVDCVGCHNRCELALNRGFSELGLKRSIADCVAKELQRDINLDNRKKAINGHTHDASGKAIFGGME
jgi:hypothetical protein